VACHHCGHRNQRIKTRCVECNGKLHHTGWKRSSKKLAPNKRNLAIWQFALLVVAVWITYQVIVYLAEFRARTPE
jgi:hypothetical protein